jgi:hypothetical protein
MKNGLLSVCVLTIVSFVGIGCGLVDRLQNSSTGVANANSNKTLTDKAVDSTVGEQKIGIPECDEVMDMLTEYANNPDDNFVVKAGKAVIVNKIKESIKQSIEENKTDKVEMAKNCKEAKVELEKYKAEEEKKKAQ